jgi:hypothetical protein
MTIRRHAELACALLALGLAACGGGDVADEQAPATEAAEAAAPEPGPMSVQITSPAEGAELDGASVVVSLDVSGLTIVPAGDQTPQSGHHHLIVNADLPPMDQPIPSVEGQYIHMGAGQTEFELTDLPPGPYRVIALVGDFAHVPLDPPVADTVHFRVRE